LTLHELQGRAKPASRNPAAEGHALGAPCVLVDRKLQHERLSSHPTQSASDTTSIDFMEVLSPYGCRRLA
jgi:hypothetical protein